MSEIGATFTIDKMHKIKSYISIQGNIGAGKSTRMQHIKRYIEERGLDAQHPGPEPQSDYYLLIDEPVKSWTEERYPEGKFGDDLEAAPSHTSLGLFYSDMERWGFTFQIKAFTSRLRLMREEIGKISSAIPENARIHIIADRSLRTDRLFFRNLYEQRKVTDTEWRWYNEFFDEICTDVMRRENVMIHIDTPYKKCFERLQRRNRAEEADDGMLAYLETLEGQHARMIAEFKEMKGTHVYRCCSDDMNEDELATSTALLMKNLAKHVSKLDYTVA